jgi:hypothetical protein
VPYRLLKWNDNWPHETGHNPYTPNHRALREELIRHLRIPEDGNNLAKHVGVEFGTQ